MRFTPRRRSSDDTCRQGRSVRSRSDRVPGPFVAARSAALGALVALGGLVAGAGCSPLPEIHPNFDELKPRSVYLLDTANRTTRGLEHVEFGGLAQRLTGLRVFDFPALINGNLHEELVKRGYAATVQAGGKIPPLGPSRGSSGESGAAAGAYDAYLQSTIVSWRGSTNPPYHIDLSYRVAFVDVKTGERLYGGEFALKVHADKRTPADTSFMRDGIERSVRKALRLLPPAN